MSCPQSCIWLCAYCLAYFWLLGEGAILVKLVLKFKSHAACISPPCTHMSGRDSVPQGAGISSLFPLLQHPACVVQVPACLLSYIVNVVVCVVYRCPHGHPAVKGCTNIPKTASAPQFREGRDKAGVGIIPDFLEIVDFQAKSVNLLMGGGFVHDDSRCRFLADFKIWPRPARPQNSGPPYPALCASSGVHFLGSRVTIPPPPRNYATWC